MDFATHYADVRDLARSGDKVVFNREGLVSMLGRGGASHIGTLVWRNADQDSLSIAESREFIGGRVVSLRRQVEESPGLIDIWTPNEDCPDELRERAATIAFNWGNQSYGYPVVGNMLLVRSPLALSIAKLFGYDPEFENLIPSAWDEGKVCSQLHVWAYRWAKLELAGLTRFVEPQIVNGRYERPKIADLDVSQLLQWRACLASGWDPCPFLADRWVEPADLVRSAHGGAYRCIAKGLVIG